MIDADRILAGLNDAQREAVTTVRGPLAIVAGAGSGKTRVVSHRAAWAVASGAVEDRHVLLVTFTQKAAAEMAERVRSLGLGRVTARTFHSAALAQLRHFWPGSHAGADAPVVVDDAWRIVAPLARGLPGGYRFTPTKDLMDEISWAKGRRLGPQSYEREAGDRSPPIPARLFVRLFRDYERALARRGLIDLDDILLRVVDLLETDDAAARQVRSRYAWFTVDEYQDTTPLQARLLELWLGDRRDLCVVGDEDQTIYTFAGATPAHLHGFAERYPDARVIPLLQNYRSSPQVIGLANRLLASAGRDKRLVATRAPGPEPSIRAFADADAETAFVVDRVRALRADGLPGREMAVLVRLNAQLAPLEAAFARSGIAYQVGGQGFFARSDVRAAVRAIGGVRADLAGTPLVEAILAAWRERLGFDPDAVPDGHEARERHAALSTLLAIVTEAAGSTVGDARGGEDRGGEGLGGADPGLASARDAVLAELARRGDQERSGDADGVALLTLHRAKGLEWEAVFIPSLEEGLLPVSQAAEDDEALAEERRLLYVGITRARTHLSLSWARQRPSTTGRLAGRTMSRFLRPLGGDRAAGPARTPTVPGSGRARSRGGAAGPGQLHGSGSARAALTGEDAVLFDALRAWRLERAREERVAPFIVASDAVLVAITQHRPRTMRELLAVPGIGPTRAERYGPAILALVGQA